MNSIAKIGRYSAALLFVLSAGVASALPASAMADTSSVGYTHQTAVTQFVDVKGTPIAYRRFGKPSGVPLVFFQHFTGTMDNWDPLITDGLARGREVILFDNAGVAGSGGEVPDSVEGMARVAIDFIGALGLKQVDLLGFSLGGLVAQEVTAERPALVRRLVLVGTGPRGGVGMATLTPEAQAIWGKKRAVADELWLDALFTQSAASQVKARAFLDRIRARQANRDPEVNEKVAPAQLKALAKWGAPKDNPYAYLKDIQQPTLVVNGSNDVVIYTVNSYILEQNLPNAQLILYPDANHGSQNQYPVLFVRHVGAFLDDQ